MEMNLIHNKYIEELINQGEHQQLDFKFEIADSKKIAKTLSAFANTDGGKLLIGVKDNGSIAGIRSVEEYHMLEAAAQLYCKPEITFDAKEWNINGKKILEITIPQRSGDIVKSKTENNKWLAYVRVNDQNLLANKVLLKVWKKRDQKAEIYINYKEPEKFLLNYLKENQNISLSKFCKLASIPYYKGQNILVDFILLNIIDINLGEQQTTYKLKEDYTDED